MKPEQWETLQKCAAGEELPTLPVALIVDSPWIPGFLGISTLDYLTIPDVWLKANLAVEQAFPDVIFVPGFWSEMGMAAEPSGFGCKVSLYRDKTPVVHYLGSEIDQLSRLSPPDPRSDGFMPILLNYYRQLEPQVNAAGQRIKIVAARGPLTVATHLMGVSNFLLALKLHPAETHRFLRTTTTLVRTWLEAQAEALREVEAVLVLDDIAGFISPKDYLEFAHPYLKEIFERFSGFLKMFHNDTDNPASYRYLPDLGIQVFNFTHLQPLGQSAGTGGTGHLLDGQCAAAGRVGEGYSGRGSGSVARLPAGAPRPERTALIGRRGHFAGDPGCQHRSPGAGGGATRSQTYRCPARIRVRSGICAAQQNIISNDALSLRKKLHAANRHPGCGRHCRQPHTGLPATEGSV